MIRIIVLTAFVALAVSDATGTADDSCGKVRVKYASDASRIVGGFEAKKGQFPWTVQVQNGGSHWCGGTLIHKQWVLTAAHCFYQMGNKKSFKFVLGQHNIKKSDKKNEQDFDALKIKIHPDYNDYTIKNDIALIKLKQEVKLNDYAVKACLPNKGESFTKLNCTVSGWGSLNEGGKGPKIMNAVRVPIMTLSECQNNYSKNDIFSTNICAGFPEGGKDACQGDSGGPLVCQTKDGEPWKLAGIVSWGEGCAKRGKAGVYTAVSKYIPWIKKTISGI